jgi:hypothetical protein
MTSFTQLCRAAACLAVAMAVQARAAEQERRPADPADPNAAVPASRYKPALPYRPAAPPARAPDQNWKALNQAVGAINSMSLTMGSDEPAPPQPETQGAPQPAAQAQEQEPAQHHHHHEMKQ